jgi:DNA-binding XRE family transcriptional regulator
LVGSLDCGIVGWDFFNLPTTNYLTFQQLEVFVVQLLFAIIRIVCRRVVCPDISFPMSRKEELLKFGKRLRELRHHKGYSQEKLAEIASLHRNYIGMIERGERNVTLLNIKKLARALNIETKELFD